ncbi:hypothetical protein [Streptomyces canus]|uniref:hypothetical protein n=1 Tax=Streptomyces canus TaxID=58343 RepID=UPI003245FD64
MATEAARPVARAEPAPGARTSPRKAHVGRWSPWRPRAVDERAAKRVRTFHHGGVKRTAMTVRGTEHLGLPEAFPQLESVEVGLGLVRSVDAPRADRRRIGTGRAVLEPGAHRSVAALGLDARRPGAAEAGVHEVDGATVRRR